MDEKLSRIKKAMKRKNVDLLLLSTTENMRYVTGLYEIEFNSFLCIPVNKKPFIICSLFDKLALEKLNIETISVSSKFGADIKAKTLLDALKKVLKEKKIKHKKYAYERDILPHAFAHKIDTALGKADIDFTKELDKIRSIKTQKEIKIMRQGARITKRGMKAVREFIRKGVTEREIARVFEHEVRKQADWYSFQTIVASGLNSAEPHYMLTDKKIKQNEFIVVDCGVVYRNLMTDMTRTFAIKPDKKKIKLYSTVLTAQNLAMELLEHGVYAKEVDKAARTYLTKMGYGNNFPHGTGHGIGIRLHEYPNLFQPNIKLKENMIFTIEPGVYIKGYGGVRIEDMVLLKKKGIEVLTKFPRVLKCK
jgi:Xaa-Pro aminopeptidase